MSTDAKSHSNFWHNGLRKILFKDFYKKIDTNTELITNVAKSNEQTSKTINEILTKSSVENIRILKQNEEQNITQHAEFLKIFSEKNVSLNDELEKSRRNMKIAKIVVIVVFAVWGTINLLQGDYWIAAFQYGAASFQWWGKYLFEYIAKRAAKREKKKDDTPKLPRNPSLISTYLHSHHSKICPPIAFVDDNDTEVRR